MRHYPRDELDDWADKWAARIIAVLVVAAICGLVWWIGPK